MATVAVLYASVRRTVGSGRSRLADSTLATGHLAGLVAGAVLALTPVAVLMFRFNTPDALLVFLLTADRLLHPAGQLEEASGKWLVGAGVLVGLAFLTKMLAGLRGAPGAGDRLSGRGVDLHWVGGSGTSWRPLIAMIISLGWWVALVELVPESWRPYVGGSDDNSVLGLIFGDHGLDRMLGPRRLRAEMEPPRLADSADPVARHLCLDHSPEGSADRRRPRRDLVWGGTLVVTGLSFLLMAGASDDGYDAGCPGAVDRCPGGDRRAGVAGSVAAPRWRGSGSPRP